MIGIELIAKERERQVSEEGWTPEHDAEHREGELALAGAIYAWPAPRPIHIKKAWPWDFQWWKPTIPTNGAESNKDEWRDARIRDLVKAGALIAAEIDRLQATPAEAAPHEFVEMVELYCAACSKTLGNNNDPIKDGPHAGARPSDLTTYCEQTGRMEMVMARYYFADDPVTPPSEGDASDDRLPSVGGRALTEWTVADFERNCRILIRDEQEKPNCDTRLIAVLCNAVRLAREQTDMARSAITPPQMTREQALTRARTIISECSSGDADPVLINEIALEELFADELLRIGGGVETK